MLDFAFPFIGSLPTIYISIFKTKIFCLYSVSSMAELDFNIIFFNCFKFQICAKVNPALRPLLDGAIQNRNRWDQLQRTASNQEETWILRNFLRINRYWTVWVH